MVKAGIIDPVKLIRTALIAVASVFSLLTTTGAIMTKLPKDDAPAFPPGGMGDGFLDRWLSHSIETKSYHFGKLSVPNSAADQGRQKNTALDGEEAQTTWVSSEDDKESTLDGWLVSFSMGEGRAQVNFSRQIAMSSPL
jgi:hypothetical protein